MNYLQAKNRKEWREWLKENHAIEKEVWLVYYKKHTGKPSITYRGSVEEAICFGWIDGLKKRIDDEKYTHRFTRRKVKSKWSSLNIEIAKKMIKEKKMTQFGLTFFNERIEYEKKFINTRSSNDIKLPAELEQQVKNNEKAWHNFNKLAPSHKKQFVLWITSAKRDDTKKRRLKEAIIILAQNQKLGMK